MVDCGFVGASDENLVRISVKRRYYEAGASVNAKRRRNCTVGRPLPLGEGWGVGLSANRHYNIAAGFSPQSVQELFASINRFEELTGGGSR